MIVTLFGTKMMQDRCFIEDVDIEMWKVRGRIDAGKWMTLCFIGYRAQSIPKRRANGYLQMPLLYTQDDAS
jgi:hypothetical protein